MKILQTHLVMQLPNGDKRYSLRMKQVKAEFSDQWLAAGLPEARTIILSDIIGAGDIRIQSGSELRLADGMLRLQNAGAVQGTIEANGKLIASGNAFVSDSHIQINTAAFIQG